MAKKESTKKTDTKAKATKTAAKPTPAKKTAKASAPKATPTVKTKAASKTSDPRRADNFFTRTHLETARNSVVNAIGYLEDVRDLIDDALDEIATK